KIMNKIDVNKNDYLYYVQEKLGSHLVPVAKAVIAEVGFSGPPKDLTNRILDVDATAKVSGIDLKTEDGLAQIYPKALQYIYEPRIVLDTSPEADLLRIQNSTPGMGKGFILHRLIDSSIALGVSSGVGKVIQDGLKEFASDIDQPDEYRAVAAKALGVDPKDLGIVENKSSSDLSPEIRARFTHYQIDPEILKTLKIQDVKPKFGFIDSSSRVSETEMKNFIEELDKIKGNTVHVVYSNEDTGPK
ncbi:MAG TPA: hypothetical protein VIY47_11605, partial [Ignavibacteriaceae bacterium]